MTEPLPNIPRVVSDDACHSSFESALASKTMIVDCDLH